MASVNYEMFAKQMRAGRKILGLTQTDLAEKLSVSTNSISKLEKKPNEQMHNLCCSVQTFMQNQGIEFIKDGIARHPPMGSTPLQIEATPELPLGWRTNHKPFLKI